MIVALVVAASVMSFSVMPPTARCTKVRSTSLRPSLRRLSVTASSEPCTSALRIRLSAADSPRLDLVEDVLELDAGLDPRSRRAGRGPDGGTRGPRRRCEPCFSSGAARNSSPASGTDETEHLDRGRRTGDLDLLALVVDHRPDTAPRGAGHDRVADLELALVDEDRGNRATTLVEVGLEHDALGATRRVGLQVFELGHDRELIEQVVDAELLRRRHLDDDRVAAPGLGHEFVLGEFGSAHAADRRCPCRSC